MVLKGSMPGGCWAGSRAVVWRAGGAAAATMWVLVLATMQKPHYSNSSRNQTQIVHCARLHLVLYQRNEGRHHQHNARAQRGGQGIAQALAAWWGVQGGSNLSAGCNRAAAYMVGRMGVSSGIPPCRPARHTEAWHSPQRQPFSSPPVGMSTNTSLPWSAATMASSWLPRKQS